MYCECHLNMTWYMVHLHPDVPEHLQPLPEAVDGPHILQGVGTIIPAPKKSVVSCLNDYYTIALTLVTMNCLEQLVRRHI